MRVCVGVICGIYGSIYHSICVCARIHTYTHIGTCTPTAKTTSQKCRQKIFHTCILHAFAQRIQCNHTRAQTGIQEYVNPIAISLSIVMLLQLCTQEIDNTCMPQHYPQHNRCSSSCAHRKIQTHISLQVLSYA